MRKVRAPETTVGILFCLKCPLSVESHKNARLRYTSFLFKSSYRLTKSNSSIRCHEPEVTSLDSWNVQLCEIYLYLCINTKFMSYEEKIIAMKWCGTKMRNIKFNSKFMFEFNEV